MNAAILLFFSNIHCDYCRLYTGIWTSFKTPTTFRTEYRLPLLAKTDPTLWHGLSARYVTKLEFEFDNVRTSNVFNRFEIRRMF